MTLENIVEEADAQDAKIAEFCDWALAQGELRPYSGYGELIGLGAHAISKMIEHGATEPEAVITDYFMPQISAEGIAQILLQVIGNAADPGTHELSREGKALALEVAGILGPDHAQSLYRFAVLVTKLA